MSRAKQRIVAGSSPTLLAVAVAMALASGAAGAQDNAKQAKAETSTLEVITVTAQRREEDVQKVPISITTVEPEKIEAISAAGDDVRVLAARLPSLNIESSFGRTFPRFYIRGLGNTDFDLNASQPVSLIYDEVVLENPIVKGFPAFDLDRIELLRGPQGTLFGRNTPAGVVKFESVKPSDEFDAYVRANYGSYGNAVFEGAVGGGISETMSARVSMLYNHRDDWVDNDFTGEKDALEGYNDFAARGQLLFETDSFSGLFNLHGRNLNGTARLFRANIIKQGEGGLVSGFDRDSVTIDGKNEQDLDAFGGSARLRWDFENFSFYSVTGYESVEVYSRGDIDGGFGAVFLPSSGPGLIPFASESADGIPDLSQWTQEFRFESRGDGPWDWQAGFFYFNEDIDIESFSYDSLFCGGCENGFATQSQENTAWALFGSVGYQINEEWKIRGGLRYTDDEKEFTAERFVSPLAFLGVGPIGPISVDPSDDDISGDFSVNFSPTDSGVNWYGRVAKGFRAPSIQGRILFGDIVSVGESETVWSYEAGVKAKFWDDRARIGFNVFHYTVEDPQLTAVGGQTNFNTLINADELTGNGFELDFEALLTDHFVVTAGLGYNDTEIDDNELLVAICGSATPCTVTDPTVVVGGATLARIDGNQLPQAPEWTGNITARWSMPVGNGGEFYVYTDWAYRDEVNFFLYESKEFRGDSLLEGGLRVGYNWNYGKYGVSLFGRNITDEEELVGGIDFNNLTGFINEPRVWGIEFNAKW